MLTLKLVIGLICLLYPSRVGGASAQPAAAQGMTPETAQDETLGRDRVHADQIACGTIQALIQGHAT
ncbi:hypothetical protein [Oligoflexus tunisiensis]|uniref:hypothetical protein n=1 Tax=Oligoflexus tunisiensis TaxID=708132 RepID=UPI00114C86BC|nr:hypothetical protein [Oligoflexus tunisiensis]